jgi:hypothetical protein
LRASKITTFHPSFSSWRRTGKPSLLPQPLVVAVAPSFAQGLEYLLVLKFVS